MCAYSNENGLSVILEGRDVSTEIRTETVGNTASQAATFPRVREALLRRRLSVHFMLHRD